VFAGQFLARKAVLDVVSVPAGTAFRPDRHNEKILSRRTGPCKAESLGQRSHTNAQSWIFKSIRQDEQDRQDQQDLNLILLILSILFILLILSILSRLLRAFV
jgi:hypothetical protein